MLNLILSGIFFKNKFAIGKNNKLLVEIPDDLKYFQRITTQSSNAESTLETNVVLMGSKTWLSLPKKSQPLKNRINLVLTNNKKLHSLSPLPKNGKYTKEVYYLTFEQFVKFYKKTNANVFVIGGGMIYNKFLSDMKPDKIYLTEIFIDKQFVLDANIFVDAFDKSYKLISISEKKYFDVVAYRHLVYSKDTNGSQQNDEKYIQLCKNVLENGENRIDRTGTGTISTFGQQIHFDISKSIPLLTTKFVPWRHVIEELLWFMRGDTDTKLLSNKGVKIWDGNTTREFLDSRGLYSYDQGILGKGYGWQWRFFGAKYHQLFANTSMIDRKSVGGFDQLQYVIDEIKNNPSSRRILMSYWNPCDLDKTALPPCHYSCQFYVHNNKELDCHFTMRSTDCGLGLPFNIASYAVFTYIIAMKCGLTPGKLVYTGGDVHIYKNHIKRLYDQLKRVSRPEPYLILNDEIKNKKLEEITIADFDVIGYFPHPAVKMTMAI
jgi:dihydrofolate reductase/thymidylate synthase